MRLAGLVVVAVLVVLGCNEASRESDSDVIVGVLEDIPGHYVGEAASRKVRVLFKKSTDGWQSFPNNCPDQDCLKTVSSAFPPRVKWTVAYNGTSIGTIDAETPPVFDYYSGIGLQTIAPGAAVPTIGERTAHYAGFDADVKYRPLATISRANVIDPDGWRSVSLPSEIATTLRRTFRSQFPNVRNCVGPDGLLQPWEYSDSDIHIDGAYTSNKSWTVATMWLEDRCDGGPPEAPFRGQMIAIAPTGDTLFIGEGLSFLDGGDYDADGQSEVLCFMSGYNRGGYALFYDDFRRSATFEFHYH